MNLTQAIKFFGAMPLAVEASKKAALTRAAKVIQKEAKRVIGTFDYGWPPLADSTVARKGHDDPLIDYSSGHPGALIRDTIDTKVIGSSAFIGSDSDVAAFNELGTSKAPPRSFLAGAAHAKGKEAAEECASELVYAGMIGRGRRLMRP
jgi:hypothetical protein